MTQEKSQLDNVEHRAQEKINEKVKQKLLSLD